MAQDSFELACDRLSGAVDGVLFERLRWARTEGPMLARLVELAQGAVEARGDIDLSDEGINQRYQTLRPEGSQQSHCRDQHQPQCAAMPNSGQKQSNVAPTNLRI